MNNRGPFGVPMSHFPVVVQSWCTILVGHLMCKSWWSLLWFKDGGSINGTLVGHRSWIWFAIWLIKVDGPFGGPKVVVVFMDHMTTNFGTPHGPTSWDHQKNNNFWKNGQPTWCSDGLPNGPPTFNHQRNPTLAHQMAHSLDDLRAHWIDHQLRTTKRTTEFGSPYGLLTSWLEGLANWPPTRDA